MTDKKTESYTQKDLMQHLLNVAQHSATREDMSEMRAEFNDRFDKVDAKFDKINDKIGLLVWQLLGGMVAIVTIAGAFFKV